MWAREALERFLAYPGVETVLDVGSGAGEHAVVMRRAGKEVVEVDWSNGQDYNTARVGRCFDGIWCSHVLEHQPNVNAFLTKLRGDLRPGGILAITVPPAKHEVVGGHLTIWNQGLLLYNLVMAGWDCSEARVSPVYDGYNISVIVARRDVVLPVLRYDHGDIETLAQWFPLAVGQGFRGDRVAVGW